MNRSPPALAHKPVHRGLTIFIHEACGRLMQDHCHCSICLSHTHTGMIPQCLSLQQFKSSSVIWPNPFLSLFSHPFPVLCVCPTHFLLQEVLWLIFKAAHLTNVQPGYSWWLGNLLLQNSVYNGNGWIVATPFMAGLVWLLSSLPLLI